MKKLLIPGLVLAAISCSPAFAETSSIALDSGTTTTVSNDTAGCLILSTSVGVGLSANVNGGIYCAQADGITASKIFVGTCHIAGLTKTRNITCSRQLKTDGSGDYNYAPSTCTATNFPADLPATSVVYGGPSFFSGDTSTGGGIAENDLTEVCNKTNSLTKVEALADPA